MLPHEERVVEELRELSEKRGKLGTFISGSPTFAELPVGERSRLIRQHDVMGEYESILRERIANFLR